MIAPRCRRVALIATLIALSGATMVRAQTREARPNARGTAAISGIVVSDEPEPRPVRRVRVTCNGPDFAATAISDDRGRFVFAGLKPGRYTIAGAKDAWVPSAYGAKRPLRPGSAVPVAEGQTVPIMLRMLRGAVITGVLLDHNNQPAANTSVNARRYAMQSGVRRLTSAGSALTDDRGVYRIYGLAPGDYLVGAAPRVTGIDSAGSELRLIDQRGERTVALSPTYFPGSPVATQAAAVTLRAGEERDGIDFALQLVPTARIEGTVTSVDGAPAPPGTEVSLIASTQTTFPGMSFAGIRSTRVSSDGVFRFADVSPGAYTILARGSAAETAVMRPGVPAITWATTEISVDGESITGLALGLQPAMMLTGQLKFDATRLKPAAVKSIQVGLQPVQSGTTVNFAPSGAMLDDEGHFLIGGIIPGTYRVTVSLPGLGRPGNWYLRSAIVKGQDTADVPVTIAPNELIHGALVTLSDRPAQLSGTVQNTAGGAANEYTVILFPADASLWLPQSRRVQGIRPSADGAFTFRGLPPGDYLLAAIDDVEPNEWFDPGLLRRLVATAMKIAVAEGEEKVQDIRLSGGG